MRTRPGYLANSARSANSLGSNALPHRPSAPIGGTGRWSHSPTRIGRSSASEPRSSKFDTYLSSRSASVPMFETVALSALPSLRSCATAPVIAASDGRTSRPIVERRPERRRSRSRTAANSRASPSSRARSSASATWSSRFGAAAPAQRVIGGMPSSRARPIAAKIIVLGTDWMKLPFGGIDAVDAATGGLTCFQRQRGGGDVAGRQVERRRWAISCGSGGPAPARRCIRTALRVRCDDIGDLLLARAGQQAAARDRRWLHCGPHARLQSAPGAAPMPRAGWRPPRPGTAR